MVTAESEKGSGSSNGIERTDELSVYLTTYEAGPHRPYFKTTPSKTLIDTLTSFSKNERLLLFSVVAITLATRLYALDYPNSVVFDEVHFGTFASRYAKGEFLMDVHPPLVKMIYYLVSYFCGYKGDFDFSGIGNKYVDEEGNVLVPYLPMRAFSALSGIATVLLVYRIAKLSGCRPVICAFGSLLCCFENSLVTQSRYILLDAPMLLFIALIIFNYKAVQACQPFTKRWFRYLSLLGFSLAAVISTKFVGFLTMAWLGLLILRDFWFLCGDLQVPTKALSRHFGARFYFLVITPLVFYLGLFAVHFLILPRVGEGASLMSSRFQNTLENSIVHDFYSDIGYGSTVSIRHLATGGFLHSHEGTYPKTGNQQVTTYGFQDHNNDWIIEKKTKANASELFDKFQSIPNLQKVRLFHAAEKRYLRVNDVRPPMSEQDYNNEVTLIGDEDYLGDGSNEVFEIRIIRDRSVFHPGSEFQLKAVDSVFQIYHTGTGCYLLSHDVKLPKWGFEQNEVICIEKPSMENSLWYFEKNIHPVLVNDPAASKISLPALSIWQKLAEVHRVMFRINNGLTTEHSFSSEPISWPFVLRGVNYWGEEHKNVYLFGNLVTYWSVVIVVVALSTFVGIKACSVLKPSFFTKSEGLLSSDPKTVKFVNYALEFALGWFIHFAPFFAMERQLFLHHYMPSLFFGILLVTQTAEFVWAKNKYIGVLLTITVTSGALYYFWKYSALIYGLDWNFRDCEDSKYIFTWDFNCKNYIPDSN